jgi:hypothetical protein
VLQNARGPTDRSMSLQTVGREGRGRAVDERAGAGACAAPAPTAAATGEHGDVLQPAGYSAAAARISSANSVPASTVGVPGTTPGKSAGPKEQWANSTEFEDWKKRTDNQAAAVLAAVRVFRGPSSPPTMTHVTIFVRGHVTHFWRMLCTIVRSPERPRRGFSRCNVMDYGSPKDLLHGNT